MDSLPETDVERKRKRKRKPTGRLVWGVTRIVPYQKEILALDKEQLLIFEFMSAYHDLRRSCSMGDLHIYISVEGSPEQVGAVLRPEGTDDV